MMGEGSQPAGPAFWSLVGRLSYSMEKVLYEVSISFIVFMAALVMLAIIRDLRLVILKLRFLLRKLMAGILKPLVGK